MLTQVGRLSIYLPDELEARAKALQPNTPTSQVVRAALERYLGSTGPAYAEPPEDIEDLLADGVAHFANLARQDYQDGYRAALKRLPDLDWDAITGFAREGFDLYKWLNGWCQNINQAAIRGDLLSAKPHWFGKLAEDLGSLADAIGYDDLSFRKTAPYEHGYADALRAGYEAALRAGIMTSGAGAAARKEATDAPVEDE
jgi:hypothetical protein